MKLLYVFTSMDLDPVFIVLLQPFVDDDDDDDVNALLQMENTAFFNAFTY